MPARKMINLLQETHIMHEFGKDFYDSWLRVLICGYIRPEENFASLGNKWHVRKANPRRKLFTPFYR